MIRQVFYVSQQSASVDNATLQSILAVSRKNNWRADITGLLMASGTHFAQVLEGRPADVERLLGKVASDARHERMRILLDRSHELRQYGDWSMGHVWRSVVADDLQSLFEATDAADERAVAFLGFLRADTIMGTL